MSARMYVECDRWDYALYLKCQTVAPACNGFDPFDPVGSLPDGWLITHVEAESQSEPGVFETRPMMFCSTLCLSRHIEDIEQYKAEIDADRANAAEAEAVA